MAKKPSKNKLKATPLARRLRKVPSGIRGLDELTAGGLPAGRATLVCGGPGSGKTLFGMEFLVHGALDHGEPGVFMAFEESVDELSDNVASLGFNLDELVAGGQLMLLQVRFDADQTTEVGGYDLDGLFIRLGHAIDTLGAKRVVLDAVEALLTRLPNQARLRRELQRLFSWLKDRGVTVIITGERGEGLFTRTGLEEYVSDCVISLDHRVIGQISTRRLRVVKYRGSTHGTNEYPFLIDAEGIVVLPITALNLDHEASDERISSGVDELDQMLDGGGFYRASTVLVSGTAGTGKTTLAAHFVEAACRRGERALYFALEESEQQLLRNQRSVGIQLKTHVQSGHLRIHATRATRFGLETHLATLLTEAKSFKPQVVVIDPITSFLAIADPVDVRAMMTRLVDVLKVHQITAYLLSLSSGTDGTMGYSGLETTEAGISSLVDSWLLVRDMELGGERNLGLYVLKSRGMAHSNQIREFLITDRGVKLVDAYLGPDGALTGSMRVAEHAREHAESLSLAHNYERERRKTQQRMGELDAQLAVCKAEVELQQLTLEQLDKEEQARREGLEARQRALAESRRALNRRTE